MNLRETTGQGNPGACRRIRVAHLITNFALGGAQDYFLTIVRGLDRQKFEPLVAGRMEGEWVPLVHSLPGVVTFDIPSFRREITPWHDLKAMEEVRRFCREEKIDILHTHSSKAGIAGRIGGYLAQTPIIIHTVHGFSFHNFMSPVRRNTFIAAERMMSRFTTSLLFVSHHDRAAAERHHIGAQRFVEVIYNGVDYAPFVVRPDRDDVRRSLGFDSQHYVVGFTGRFSQQKGLHILVKAFAELLRERPHMRLLLVGEGPLRCALEEQVRSLAIGHAVVMTGFRSDIPRILSAMDVFVMTSYWEGLSRSLSEAMYAKLPLIATDVGGTSDAVRSGETGWLIPPDSVEETVRALQEAIGNPAKAQAMAERGHLWAREAFDLHTMHERIADLYERLAAERLPKAVCGQVSSPLSGKKPSHTAREGTEGS